MLSLDVYDRVYQQLRVRGSEKELRLALLLRGFFIMLGTAAQVMDRSLTVGLLSVYPCRRLTATGALAGELAGSHQDPSLPSYGCQRYKSKDLEVCLRCECGTELSGY